MKKNIEISLYMILYGVLLNGAMQNQPENILDMKLNQAVINEALKEIKKLVS